MAQRRVLVICDECHGTGEKQRAPHQMIGNMKSDECPRCKGEGVVRAPLPTKGEG